MPTSPSKRRNPAFAALDALQRYAAGVNKRLEWRLVDADDALCQSEPSRTSSPTRDHASS